MNEWFKNHLLRQPQSSLSSAAAKTASRAINLRYRSLLASCLAGIFNVLITNPLGVTNLRIATGDAKYNDLISEMIHTIRQHNNTIQHLWSGTMASLLLVSNPVIQFFVYEELKTWQPGNNNSQRKPHQITPIKAFVIGAIAKTIATILTYPLQVAQSLLRMQEKMNHKIELNTECAKPPKSYTGTSDCLKQLYQQNGIISLYTGIRAKLLQTVLTAAFTFVSYEQIVQTLHTFLLFYRNNHSTRKAAI
jgi:solute carrier family 25 (peroxisomal adenine nucleotide transporter), member 17